MSVKFNETDCCGKQIEINTPTKDAMLAALQNANTPQSQKNLATETLQWYSAKMDGVSTESELNKAAVLMLVEGDARDLWSGKFRFEKRKVGEVEKIFIVNCSGELANLFTAA
jgi:hypothetical protein